MGDWHAAASGKIVEEAEEDPTFRFVSRRSPVLCRHACVATSQPLASSIGLSMLRAGANAADTAIAVAAALAVTEPCSTGLGGDMFCLYYEASSKTVTAINGSGKSPQKLTMELLRQTCSSDKGILSEEMFSQSAHTVTVPGAARGWEDLLLQKGSGKFRFADLVEPAAKLAEEGFPVAPVTAHHWDSGMSQIKAWLDDKSRCPLTTNGRDAPRAGEIFANPDMARVLRELGSKGATEGFYDGNTGRRIIEAVQKHGGVMTMDDLAQHTSTFPEPIAATYRGVKLWQVPPNGQGVAALVALAGLEHLEQSNRIMRLTPNSMASADALHVQIEMMRLGFQDARDHVADPEQMKVTNEYLTDPVRIGSRAEKIFDPTKATIHGGPLSSSCTVSFQCVDEQGNAISFVNSNFKGFGTGIVPEGCGFTIQNRGQGFSLEPGHPNALGPAKRPYHTIIPGMLTYHDSGDLYATLSNMGGNMQPQGHLQLTVDMVAGDMDPQAAIDLPRFCIADGSRKGVVFLENDFEPDVVEELKRRGHKLQAGVKGHSRSLFGRAQIIKRDRESGVLWAGSDGRADGCAMGF